MSRGERPRDFDTDGSADLVIAAPLEAAGSLNQADRVASA
jgi:hypothetical protein